MTVNNALHILNPLSRQIRLQKKKRKVLVSKRFNSYRHCSQNLYTDLEVSQVKVTNFTMQNKHANLAQSQVHL